MGRQRMARLHQGWRCLEMDRLHSCGARRWRCDGNVGF
jgi:hypothetical protein